MTRGNKRKLVVVLLVVAAGLVLAVTLGRGSSTSSTADKLATKNAAAIDRTRESQRTGGGEGDADSAAAEDYASRAYPGSDVTFAQTETAIAAGQSVAARGSKLTSKWEPLGPSTLEVDRLGTRTYQRQTEWSGGETAMAIDPKCKPEETDDGAHWSLVSGSTAVAANRSIGAVAIDPADASHILIGTRSGTRGVASNGGALTAPRPGPGHLPVP